MNKDVKMFVEDLIGAEDNSSNTKLNGKTLFYNCQDLVNSIFDLDVIDESDKDLLSMQMVGKFNSMQEELKDSLRLMCSVMAKELGFDIDIVNLEETTQTLKEYGYHLHIEKVKFPQLVTPYLVILGNGDGDSIRVGVTGFLVEVDSEGIKVSTTGLNVTEEFAGDLNAK